MRNEEGERGKKGKREREEGNRGSRMEGRERERQYTYSSCDKFQHSHRTYISLFFPSFHAFILTVTLMSTVNASGSRM